MCSERVSIQQLAIDGNLASAAAEVLVDNSTSDAIVRAHDATAALWFSLDEIEAVVRSIELVQEHMEEGDAKAGRVFAMVRTVCELLGTAQLLRDDIEEALSPAMPKM